MASQPDIEVAFEGTATENHELDADLVAASIVGVQKAVRMIASAQVEGWSGDRRRYRATKAMRETVVVKVAAPKPGSLVLPMSVTDATGEDNDLVGIFGSFFDWLAGDDDSRPELAGNVLDHLLRSALDWLPQRSDVSVRLRLRGVDHRVVNSTTRERAEDLLAQGTFAALRLIGEVTRAYLEEGQIRLKHPPTGRTFRVDVPKEVRTKLSLDRGQWVEVAGRFRCDHRGEPVEVQSIEDLRLPDLSPIELGEIPLDRSVLHPTRRIQLGVALDDDTHQLFVVEDPAIGLHAFAYDRTDLLTEIEDNLRFLWKNYARASNDELAPDAIDLAERLRTAFKERRP